jgi:hypothetical protein
MSPLRQFDGTHVLRSSPPFCGTFSASRQFLFDWGDTNLALICAPIYSGTFPQIQVQPVYFNDPKVKEAIHAPVEVEWSECATQSVFVGSEDTSLPSSFEVLPRVMAHGIPTVVVTGLADFAVLSEGWDLSTPAFDQ